MANTRHHFRVHFDSSSSYFVVFAKTATAAVSRARVTHKGLYCHPAGAVNKVECLYSLGDPFQGATP